MLNLAVLFGSRAAEHDVSIISGLQILENADKSKYNAFPVYVSRKGEWFIGEPLRKVETYKNFNGDQKGLTRVILPPVPGMKGLYTLGSGGLFGAKSQKAADIDCAIFAFHGMHGEDGTMQGLFELARIPYVGCGVAASANTMDKAITKLFVDDLGITQARHVVVHRRKYLADPQRTAEEAVAALGLPLFVKPARAGSSIGVGKAKTIEEVRACIEDALQYDRKLVLEENIVGQEIEVAVFGDADGEVLTSCVGEIAPQAEFYTYEAKYDDEGTALFIPARISDDASVRVRSAAEKIYRCLSGFGLSRVDFFLRNGEEVVFNEINAIPGFTSISMYPQLFAASGIPYPELIDRLVMLAMER